MVFITGPVPGYEYAFGIFAVSILSEYGFSVNENHRKTFRRSISPVEFIPWGLRPNSFVAGISAGLYGWEETASGSEHLSSPIADSIGFFAIFGIKSGWSDRY